MKMTTLEPKLSGNATPEGTARYAARFVATGIPETAFRLLGTTGLTTSLLGFGSYRIDEETPAHAAALSKALREGCNLIDTSTNYSDGSSETCIGITLQSLIALKKIARDEVILVSKVGYVQGSNLEIAEKREAEGVAFPEMVKYMDGCWHCIHPDFISEQLELSLQRLQSERLDVYLLHNPEYFLSDANQRGDGDVASRRKAFYERIEKAFIRLEEEVKKGRISYYGVSSNTVVAPADDPEATSLSEMLGCAKRAAQNLGLKESHFQVIQLPANLLESGAVLEKNTGTKNNSTVLATAQANKLGVLINRPLNAIIEGQLFRMANFSVDSAHPSSRSLLPEVKVLEDEFVTNIAPQINTGPGVSSSEFFQWADELSKSDINLSLEQWQSIQSRAIIPRVNYLVGQLNDFMVGDLGQVWEGWRDRYLPELKKLLSAVENECAARSEELSQRFSHRINKLLPEAWRSLTLSQKSIGILAHTKGVTSVLNGMRTPDYVNDSLAVLRQPPFQVDEKIYGSLTEPKSSNA